MAHSFCLVWLLASTMSSFYNISLGDVDSNVANSHCIFKSTYVGDGNNGKEIVTNINICPNISMNECMYVRACACVYIYNENV